ncbi:MAG: fasciclin domain-containing protein [Candidatus Saccharimonadales bacterium]
MNKKIIILISIAILLIGLGVFAYWFFVLQSSSDDTKSQQSTQSEASKPASDKDVSTLLGSTGSASTFYGVLKTANLLSNIQGQGPFTIIAPSNAAFNALPSGTLDRLQKPENIAQLTNIMNYHIISGSLLTSQLTNGQKIKTANGQEVVVSIEGSNIYFVGAKGDKALVTKSDIKAQNGVIHITDAVLLPQ